MLAGAARVGDLTAVEASGEKTEPFTTPAVGVTVPESLGEPASEWVGREVVEAKRVDNEALERRYGRCVTEERGDLRGRVLGTWISESESCGDCKGSSGVGGIRGACGSAEGECW